jgi:hypothetical protein
MPLHTCVVGQARPHRFCRSMASRMGELQGVKEGATSGRCPDVPFLWSH